MRKGFTRKFEPLRILSNTQVEYMHSTTPAAGAKLHNERTGELSVAFDFPRGEINRKYP